MKIIETVAIIGLGALGTMYGKHFLDHGAGEGLRVIVDEKRKNRYEREGIWCNGEPCSFNFHIPSSKDEAVDLVIFAVKFNDLEQAMEDAAPMVGEETMLLSLLNGVSSEEILGQCFGRDKVVYCVALGMDAVKLGPIMTYTNKGVVNFGAFDERDQKEEKIEAIAEYFDRVSLPYQIDNHMKRKLWSKFMVNVGVNQTTMVFETNYGGIHAPGKARDTMISAMEEVMALSIAEGIGLTTNDLETWLGILDGLDPDGMPSMRQDALRGQKSEVELFSGTCIALGVKHGIPTPVNDFLYERIKEMEKKL
jgi:2-dehydropantoate 2-reductase